MKCDVTQAKPKMKERKKTKKVCTCALGKKKKSYTGDCPWHRTKAEKCHGGLRFCLKHLYKNILGAQTPQADRILSLVIM